jgi:hypothetical protein
MENLLIFQLKAIWCREGTLRATTLTALMDSSALSDSVGLFLRQWD